MICFQDIFMKNGGQPFEYNGETVFMMDRIQIKNNFEVSIKLVSTNSRYAQIIELKVAGRGYLRFCDEKKNRVSILADELNKHKEIRLSGNAKDAELLVWNSWLMENHLGNSAKHSWHNGAAMKKSVEGNTIRYYCNDGAPDDDFDDLIFEVTLL